jgi:nitrogenase molybdenum-cofactor synthesis protein NifE
MPAGARYGANIGRAVITHGPDGCAYFSWDKKPYTWRGGRIACCYRSFSTDMTEKDVIYGGEKSLPWD